MAFDLDIESIFSHPPVTPEVAEFHQRVRDGAKILAKDWDMFLPACPEKTLAIRSLQQAMMWANSAIAQNGIRTNTLIFDSPE